MSIHYPSGQNPLAVHERPQSRSVALRSSYAQRGMSLEAEINASNQYYLANHIAVIHKKPTPVQLVKVDYPKRSAAVIREAYFKQPSTTDYNGIYKGWYIDFDAKETRNKASFPLKNFHEHQIRHMRECVDQGGICFALIRFVELDQMYVFPATSLFEYWQRQLHGGRKSIPLTAIIQDGYPVQYGLNPRLHYLTAVDQLIAAKKH